MPDNERRIIEKQPGSELKSELNQDQLMTLSSIEHFGWELKFIRRKLFQPKVAVVFDRDKKRYAILEADGTLNDKVDDLKIR
ncbi:MAG TPA: hypothetical protein PLF92_06455 [Arenimonas sp.]|jgi:hypothetical protein|nr:hypothetical protein [Arenimonas sp.]HOZ06015.1 hypothetical protein [Arenimonas sp.]HPW32534.1 hypothetical protein [Arenimonas sp.]